MQNDLPLPIDDDESRSSENFLPKYFRTDTNKKFLSTTIDQMINQGTVEKINSFAGRRNARATQYKDTFYPDVSNERENYQFEPATVVKDTLDNVSFYGDYIDYIGVLNNFGSNTKNHSLLNQQKAYSLDSHIDWDKFSNFREYYWLPLGPLPITVIGQSKEVTSTYKVTTSNQDDNTVYVFTPNGFTKNPTITLYKEQTYRFEIDTPGHPLAFALNRNFDDADPGPGIETQNLSRLYITGVTKYIYDAEGKLIETNEDYVEKGVIEFTVPATVPDDLFYLSKNDINTSGIINTEEITENSEIDVSAEIIGKKTYTTSNGIKLSNGMKVRFAGSVVPEIYGLGEWFVEGVGTEIRLINQASLEVPAVFTTELEVPFDEFAFDNVPFENADSYPADKDYITINRGSADRNPWSRYNRWFHRDVIIAAAEANNTEPNIDQDARAKRPIIEFEAGLKLWHHGAKAKTNVNLVDTFTKDVFSTIEGSLGYNIDGVNLSNGMRVLFTADPDSFVNGKIYVVNFIEHNGRTQISLVEDTDSTPELNETVLVLSGDTYKGKMFFYNGTEWKQTQDKTTVNQPPLFDLFDNNGVDLNDSITYPSSTFNGNKIFSYATGAGANDTVLGFPLKYRNIANIGDIVFDFNLVTQTIQYQDTLQNTLNISSDINYLKKFNASGENYEFKNAWKESVNETTQPVIRQYNGQKNNFEIDVFDRPGNLDDLFVKVEVNGKSQQDFDLEKRNSRAFVNLPNDLQEDSIVVLKCFSGATKNNNGYYEIPLNLERNPDNKNITSFTLGEVNDHVKSIAQFHPDFQGNYLGVNNLRDLGNVSSYGKLLMQHTGPLNIALYHLTSKKHNAVQGLDYARREYAAFKKTFLSEAQRLGFSGNVKNHVDLILETINKDKSNIMPFYSSDMIPYNAFIVTEHVVDFAGPNYFALATNFNLESCSNRAVGVYLNDVQLIHNKDYKFENGFVYITYNLAEDDIVKIYEYENTNGSYVPPTPTKLGLLPAYEPVKYTDTSYQENKLVIQGHDGSILLGFNDYRDDLLLELETRIYNNIKVKNDSSILDINDFVPSYNRITGFDIKDIDSITLSSFTEWLAAANNLDYTTNTFVDINSSFTWNYSVAQNFEDVQLQGFWRSIYKFYYDTDRPHTHPWEMVGYTIKPTWWETSYGPSPYTRNNSILWQDLEEGAIREPGKPITRIAKYARKDLTRHIPVNDYGQLISPVESGLSRAPLLSAVRNNFVFGDQAPTETAWRRSSEYKFALLKAWMLLEPAKVLGIGLDRSRITTDIVGNIVWKDTMKRITTSDIVVPRIENNTQYFAAGIINYIVGKISERVDTNIKEYKDQLANIKNQLGIRLGGFADKNKLKLVLDSRSPLNKTSVFVPDENYNIFLNKSTVQETASISGIIIEKNIAPDGESFLYTVRGYDTDIPIFKTYEVLEQFNDTTITVGGISEDFVEWNENKTYPSTTVVFYQGQYYRSNITHQSTEVFEPSKFSLLSSLPITGGETAIIRKRFDKSAVKNVYYGTKFDNIQEVADFMQGYEEYLVDQGFKFSSVSDAGILEDMTLCIKEFLFFTTQNWADGTVISVSPIANALEFSRENYGVDDIYDPFYNYNVLTGEGTALSPNFTNLFRKTADFALKPIGTDDGVFLAKIPLIQTEHVVLLDNETVFNDIIYDVIPGYRQERIKLVGYKTSNWDGTLNIPGFIYDEAKVVDWTPNTDYTIGDLVKYKQFYYSSNESHTSSVDFNSSKWTRLKERPAAQLYPNWDYKANQFADFYDLDTDNFDTEQQRLAQHLIGYQDREYLANIITDKSSQYKFYQGMIQDKGTANVLTKLFDPLSTANEDSIEFFEEWALRVGQYGAIDNLTEVEYQLNDEKFRLEPQIVELVQSRSNRTDLTFEIPEFEVYSKPNLYTHAPFAIKNDNSVYTYNGGYVRDKDVKSSLQSYDDILTLDIDSFNIGDNIWVTKRGRTWDVYKNTKTSLQVEAIAVNADILDDDNGFTISVDTYNHKIVKDDIIGVYSGVENANGFWKVKLVEGKNITVVTENEIDVEEFDNSSIPGISRLVSRRFDTVTNLNNNIEEISADLDDTVWLDDNGTGNWSVYTNKSIFDLQKEIGGYQDDNESGFLTSFSVNPSNTTLAIGSPDLENTNNVGAVRVLYRNNEQFDYRFDQELKPNNNHDDESLFGYSVSVSKDGSYIAVGAPAASNVRTLYIGDLYDSVTSEITANDIISDRGILFKAKQDLVDYTVGQNDSTLFDSTNGQLNQDFEPAFLIEAVESGRQSGLSNQGVVYVFKKNLTSGRYEVENVISSPDPVDNEKFGYNVEFRNDVNEVPRLFVGAPGARGGRIYFVDRTDEVWKYSVDRKYRGIHNSNYAYAIDDVVFYENNLYQAKTAIGNSGGALPTDGAKWTLLTTDDKNDNTTDYVGRIPAIDESETLEDSTLRTSSNIGQKFDVNQLGSTIAFTSTTNEKIIVLATTDTSAISLNNTITQNAGSASGTVVSFEIINNKTFVRVKDVAGTFQRSVNVFSADSTDLGEVDDVQDNTRLSVYNKPYNRWQFVQNINGSDYTNFANNIAVNDNGSKIAVSNSTNGNGSIEIYKLNNNEYIFNQTVTSPYNEDNEGFGTNVKFSKNKLAIIGKQTDSIYRTIFDANETLFDNGNTEFGYTKNDVGKVLLFQEIADEFIFAEAIRYDRDTLGITLDNFDFVDNHIYVAFNDTAPVGEFNTPEGKTDTRYLLEGLRKGILADIKSDRNSDTWSVLTNQEERTDVSNINRAFIYNAKTKDVVARLDIIDPRQGKIAGPAEQELYYKTMYDPAVYSTNNDDSVDVTLDADSNWTEEQVGRLWWDLSAAAWYNPHQDSNTYRTSYWNTLLPGYQVKVCEWVATTLLPSEWTDANGTSDGFNKGITGTPLYGDDTYSEKLVYDNITKSFTSKYFYWVQNTLTVPQNGIRSISAQDVSNLIAAPQEYGYRFIAPLSSNSFAMYNCASFVTGKESILHLSFVNNKENKNNIHSEYQLLSDGFTTTQLAGTIENTWYNSLIGYDANNRPVPDTTLPITQQTGVLSIPRQSMFVNRLEAVKQFVERVNSVLIENQIVDNYVFDNLNKLDATPITASGRFDVTVDNADLLRFVEVAKTSQASLTPVIDNGKITSVTINNPGRGYKNAPVLDIETNTGKNAILETQIDSMGKITNVVVKAQGFDYDSTTIVKVRAFSALIENDDTIGGRWSIYQYANREWQRTDNQTFDTTKYWSYTDWYATGINANTAINQIVDYSYQLFALDNNIGDIVKINNIGSGGWLLLKKVDNQLVEDYTVNYNTIGRQNGTIQLDTRLYDYSFETSGYDANVYDIGFYDREPVEELRNILTALKDDIFIGNLYNEYNKLFFASLRYAFSEQENVDWAFKTSFVKAKHNISSLEQKPSYENDNLENYQDYINEVKPYKSSVREYVSSYTSVENTNSVIADFDLPPSYNPVTKEIEPSVAVYRNNSISNMYDRYQNNPFKNWVDNNKFEIVTIDVATGGSGYISTPTVTVEGDSGYIAQAFLSKGSVSSIEIVNKGSKVYSSPTVTINGNISEGGSPAKAVAILGNGLPRSTHMVLKFDRLSGQTYITNIDTTETFVGTGNKTKFDLEWPINTYTDTFEVTIDGKTLLNSEFTIGNTTDKLKGYTRSQGFVETEDFIDVGSQLVIKYKKAIQLLSAADRTKLYYKPTSGMPGNDLSQLMDGVEYDGAIYDSIDFGTQYGFDVNGFGGGFDTYSSTFEDEIFKLTGDSTLIETFTLSTPMESGIEYNVYVKIQGDTQNDDWKMYRLDDPLYDGSTVLTNKSANMLPLQGDDSTITVTVDLTDISTSEGDQIIISKSTSDGSFTPVATTYDTSLSGGTLDYGTATGLTPDSITVDGDGFYTPTSSKGPEEVVPGKILDTLDIQVYTRASDGVANIATANYIIVDDSTDVYKLPGIPQTNDAIIVKLDNEILDASRYSINWKDNTLEFDDSTSSIGLNLNIVTYGTNGTEILDTGITYFDGSTTGIVTAVKWKDEISALVTVNGVVKTIADFTLVQTNSNEEYPNRVKVQFENNILVEGDHIQFTIYDSIVKTYSQIIIDRTFESDGETNYHKFTGNIPVPFTSQPISHKILVKSNNKILNPGYSATFITTTARSYDLDKWSLGDTTNVSQDDVLVFENMVQLTSDQFTYDPTTARIILNDIDVGLEGSSLDVYITKDAEYYFADTKIVFESVDSTALDLTQTYESGDTLTLIDEGSTEFSGYIKSVTKDTIIIRSINRDIKNAYLSSEDFIIALQGEDSTAINIIDVEFITSDSLTFAIPPSSGQEIEIYQFSDHDVNEFNRYTYNVVSSTILDQGTPQYIRRNLLTAGIVQLDDPIIGTEYAWVMKNGEMLSPRVDYIVHEDLKSVRLREIPNENDVIDILQFGAKPVTPKFGYRQFKDMLGRTHYKRINKENSYVLQSPLTFYDDTIYLENTQGMFKPNRSKNIPGVLFIEGERIEYFEIKDNTVRQLRRGTLGTGVKDVYNEGAQAFSQGVDETIDYQDTTTIQTIVTSSQDSSPGKEFSLNYIPASVNELEVYVAGKKLRKTSAQIFNPANALDSTEGDTTVDPEYTIQYNTDEEFVEASYSNAVSANLILAEEPADGVKIKILSKTGKTWNDIGKSLGDSDNNIAVFLRDATINLPK